MATINPELKELIENNILAFATTGQDRPNVVAVGCVKVVSENELIVTDNYMNKTKSNLLNNKHVAIVVWNKEGNLGYQLKGEADYIVEGKWQEFVKEMEENKGMPAKAAILVNIKEIYKLA
jgi:predicted pyridoxine 5'-phosphate oxidase superfamily flavin-nucleotide-binding protein